ncbi:MAG: hypothetical protein A3I05_00995 [Deltaproteobacteria bacterium RIFCSPLOWO2_02_FULL_44_10]|nr:MAG: hypothetical protein A3C46_02055 [Deltaproteobacteria bacterium RIFCSPHIGHO2_02_FULL_44_16]OGQ45823.1 MAG: hypothetical protein A3I05_00995 [Deltaproteobacteria bacterium RIFCSPLOWO2_02_FULL_44_10]
MPRLGILIVSIVFTWSAIKPADRYTWFLEVVPAFTGFFILWYTHHRYKWTPLVLWLMLFEFIILMVGGHYTYAKVPLFDWIGSHLGWERNNYDKFAHFMQGFIPAIFTREMLIRNRVVSGPRWLIFIVSSVCLAFSAFYELVEWWVAVLSGIAAKAFLGTQGYEWDTQSDMFLAWVGSFVALFLLSRIHNRQLKRL